MADIGQITPYRNPRDAFSNREAIPGLSVREIGQATPDPAVAESSRARVAAVRQADAFVGPRPPATGIGAPPQITTPTQPGRFSQAIDSVRGVVNRAVPSPSLTGIAGSTAQAVRGLAGKVAGYAGRLAAPATAATAIYDTATTDTDQYRKRFGLETDSPSLAGDIGVRALGAASDVGNALTFGLAKKYLYRDGQDQGTQPQGIDQLVTPRARPEPEVPPNPTDQRLAAGTQTVPMEMVESPTIATPPRMVAAEPDVRAIEERASAINAQSRDIARQLDAYGPGGGGSGGASGLSSAPGGSASADRFSRESLADSQRQLAAGRGIGAMPLRGRDAAAFQGAATRALTEADQTSTGERIAVARNIGELDRAGMRDATDRRGQDIGLLNQSAAQRNAREIVDAQGRTSRDVATIGADGRLEAALSRTTASKFTPIQLPDEIGEGGIPRKMGTALLNNQTGEIVYPTGPNQGAPLADTPERRAIRDDPGLTREQKIQKLKALDAK